MRKLAVALGALVGAACGVLPGLAGTTVPPAPEPALTTKVSGAINDFGLRLLKSLGLSLNENTIISPLSVSVALTMTYNGAAGATREAIAQTLGLGTIADQPLNHANQYLVRYLQSADPKVQLEIANALWMQSGFPIERDFAHEVEEFYDASADTVDFRGNPAGALATINSWVDKSTREKIPQILSHVDPATILVLTDAVYFKGLWTAPFDKRHTVAKPFRTSPDRTVTVPLMSRSGNFPYFENADFQAVRLSYGDRHFAMYVFLPRKVDDIADFMKTLDAAHWSEWTARLTPTEGELELPKFETTWGKSLNDPLKEMGMSIAFDQNRSDFSRISTAAPRLVISDVEHKTWIKVDEEGTEAAAATSVGVVAMAIGPSHRFKMIVDHPFFFAISEQQTGAILFAGVVGNPTRK